LPLSRKSKLICIIVLAAGLSSRFGRNKLLEKINNQTLIGKVIKSAISSKADETIVVVGYEAEKIMEALKGVNCKFVFNKDFRTGQSSSVKVGVSSVMVYADAVLIHPGDVALITPEAINMVIEDYKKFKSPITVAGYKGQTGHPILFDESLFNELMKINEETYGLKAVVNRYRDTVRVVEVGSEEVLIDIDTKEDFEKYIGKKSK
jgi:molybdenum cofactor cytidylyltransferase